MQRSTRALIYLAAHPGQPFCWPCLNKLGAKGLLQEMKEAAQAVGVSYGEIEGLCSNCNQYTLVAQA
jgi:hypothetical protein